MIIKHVLFDVDGVLLKSWKWRDKLESKYNLPPEKTSDFYRGVFVDCLIGKKDLYNELTPFIKQWGLGINIEEFVTEWFETESELNNNILDIVKIFKNKFVNISIATNQEKYRTQYLWDNLKFSYYFNHIYSSYNIGYIKPNINFFKYIQNDLGLNSENILLIDDSIQNIESVQNIGWNGIYIQENNINMLKKILTAYRNVY